VQDILARGGGARNVAQHVTHPLGREWEARIDGHLQLSRSHQVDELVLNCWVVAQTEHGSEV
jgi:hypothetical protein